MVAGFYFLPNFYQGSRDASVIIPQASALCSTSCAIPESATFHVLLEMDLLPLGREWFSTLADGGAVG